MAKTQAEKDALKAAKAAEKVKGTNFTMKTADAKGNLVDFNVIAPDDSLDDDAEESLGGIYRKS